MKHYIIVKFADKADTGRLLPEIRELFDRSLSIEGVDRVEIHPSNSLKDNRYSLMIEMTLTAEGLESFDASDLHKEWKSRFGERITDKTIFDCD